MSNKNNKGVTRNFVGTILLLSLLLTACGYRGPLYLPDNAPTEQPPDTSVTGSLNNLPDEEADIDDVAGEFDSDNIDPGAEEVDDNEEGDL